MSTAALILMLQAVTGASPAPGERFSILADPCASKGSGGVDVVVCGRPDTLTPRLPLPAERQSDGPTPSNPYLRATLEGPGRPCATRMEGCTVGFGPPFVPTLVAAAKLVGGAMKQHVEGNRRRRDGGRRVAIPLADDPPVDPSQKVHP